MIAVYDVRYNSAVDLQENIDVGVSRSVDGGQTWLPMQIAMDMGNGADVPIKKTESVIRLFWLIRKPAGFGSLVYGCTVIRVNGRGGLLSLELRLKRPVSLYWLIATMMEQPGQNR